MKTDEINYQCWICPYCFDDHNPALDCKISDLKAEIDKLKAAAPRWISCKDEFPKMGQEIILKYPVGKEGYSWCAGLVDGSDDGLFVDYELDGQPIEMNCYWFSLPPEPKPSAELEALEKPDAGDK